MGLETATYLGDLNSAWPLGTDQKSTADDHIRLIKAVLQATFPNLEAAVTIKTGTFTGTLTGMTGSVTGTVNYTQVGNIVLIYVPSTITGTSNSTAMTMTGVPAGIQPSVAQDFSVVNLFDNGLFNQAGAASISGGTITFSKLSGSTYSPTGFTASGTKGLGGGSNILIYSL